VQQPVIVDPDGHVDVEPLVVWLDGHLYTYARAQELAHELARALATAAAGVCSCECMTCALGQHCGACRTGRRA
jgi:hypothetical protein